MVNADRSRQWFSLGALVLCLVTTSYGREDYAGRYTSTNLSVEIVADGGAYGGAIQRGQERFPLKAHEEAGRLQGTFTSQGNSYDFVATKEGDGLSLATGGASYSLKRVSPANPLAGAPAPNPLVQNESQAPAANALAGYSAVAATDFGRALFAFRSGATSVQGALEGTLRDLGRYFDGRPAVSGAFEDARGRQNGGASFTARLNGQPVKGFISCKLNNQGATVALVYCRADAPPGEWQKLTGAGGDGNPMREIRLRQYDFPDGTGSIGLAAGWHTNSQTCVQTVVIQGPGDQALTVGFAASVVTPDSTPVQLQRQLEASARQWGMQPPPPMQLLVAPFTAPAQALVNLVPQFSVLNQRSGGAAMRIDNIVQVQQADANVPGGYAAVLAYRLAKTSGGGWKNYRCLAQVETDPIGPGAWMIYMVELAAPAASFERDLPVMLAMLNSLHTNDQVMQQRTQDNIDASNRRFRALQEANRQLVATYERQNQDWRQNQNTQSRSAADFVETIHGYRTVEDARTGQRTEVDLGNAHDIVNKLNEFDPGRYKEIPLRDQ